ncbi:MAG: cytochrome ubiquinol oxidase subunit I [Gammaproteobacteria bacterium]|nr:cytochrome ubiquinol oxidase subunit I [Gammaproteobacteria bacterium]MCB1745616.1 cytochrome ubiquinol oxidase subunit I [Gammaproteobacteria bacterium]MCP5202237.1 cytochrome ubiquinol oxidase subunit I [Gammaproteobacteria bacterium]
MAFDAEWLARAQFAFTVSFHIVFPAFTIGLASFLAVLEAAWLVTRRAVFLQLYRYWLTIFAVAFAMGVVSGLVMSYQFGTNWGPFAEATGPILGPLLAYEVLTAFFLEAGFLGVMLFGLERVGPRLHFAATMMVAIGTLISAFWILSANSWMQTPAAYALVDGRFEPLSWPGVIFNPSFPYRFAHMVLAAYLTTACVVGAVGAWHLLREPANHAARIMFAMAVLMTAVVAPLQLVVGDLHGLNTQRHQPAKIAAMEGHFETRSGAPLYLFGWPDMDAARTRAAIAVPKLGSLILKHDVDATVTGLDAFPRDEWPNVPLLFWAFRVMVGLGLLMIAYGLTGALWAGRKRLFTTRWLHRWALAMGPAGFAALLAGWFVTEAGRQPYVVYGLMRTSEAASPIGAPGVAGSLTAFVVVYCFVFGAGVFYLFRLFARPPGAPAVSPTSAGPLRSAAGRELMVRGSEHDHA